MHDIVFWEAFWLFLQKCPFLFMLRQKLYDLEQNDFIHGDRALLWLLYRKDIDYLTGSFKQTFIQELETSDLRLCSSRWSKGCNLFLFLILESWYLAKPQILVVFSSAAFVLWVFLFAGAQFKFKVASVNQKDQLTILSKSIVKSVLLPVSNIESTMAPKKREIRLMDFRPFACSNLTIPFSM